MFKKFLPLILTLVSVSSVFGQSATITTWKGEAKGAYSIIHDDYGSFVVDGIWQYADTIAANRDIKFTIGAISSSCEESRSIKGKPNPYAYAKDVMMAEHHHEIISHSHTHSCAVGGAGLACPDEGWGQTGDFTEEIIGCTQSIEDGTGHKPQYYIYPYDQFTNLANNKLKDLGYIGSRTGWTSALGETFHRNGYNANDTEDFYPDVDGFFRTAVQIFDDNDTKSSNHAEILNSVVDQAILNSEWGNRELHNVGSSGWGSVSVDGYREHLNYVQEKVASGDLWVGTISEVLTYQIQKLKYEAVIAETGASIWEVSWNSINPDYDVDLATYLADLNYTSTLTLKVDLDGRTGDWSITQNGVELNYEVKNRIFYLDVYPHQGSLEFKLQNETNPAPLAESPIDDIKLPADFETFFIDLNHVFEDANTRDEDLVFSVSGNTKVKITLTDGIAEISSTFGWEGIENITFTAQDHNLQSTDEEVVFTVNGSNEPYLSSAFMIPSIIQAEDFDLGGSEVSYHEEDIVANTTYRVGDVDIIDNSGIKVKMSNDEWLEYSISVNTTDYFDIDLTTASTTDGNSIVTFVDGVFLETFDLKQGAESIYQSNKIYNVQLDAGNHILRLLAKGSISIDSITISTPGPNNQPVVTTPIDDYELYVAFNPFTIDLNATFEDLETQDKDLVYSVSGNTNIQVVIDNGIATISTSNGFEGLETLTFTAKDFGNLEATDMFEINVINSFENSNHSSADGEGYIYTFDQSEALNCPSMVSLSEANPGLKIESIGDGNLVFSSAGDHRGQERVTLQFNDVCLQSVLDLSHPEKQVIEVRMHSTVDVPQVLALFGDNQNVIADKDINVRSLKAGEWKTLKFSYGSMNTWGTSVMNPAKIKTISFMVRKNYHHVPQNLPGVFTIDYIKIGTELVPCPDPHVIADDNNNLMFTKGSTAEIKANEAYGRELTYQWYKGTSMLTDGGKYQGVNEATLSINNFQSVDLGDYYTAITDSCDASSNSEVKTLSFGNPTGINSSDLDSQISIFPNPANNSVNIISGYTIEEITIYSISGTEVLKSTNDYINVEALEEGVYIIHVKTDLGTTIKKLSVQ